MWPYIPALVWVQAWGKVKPRLESRLHPHTGDESSFASARSRFDHLDIRRHIKPVSYRDIVKDLQTDLAAVQDNTAHVTTKAHIVGTDAEAFTLSAGQQALTADAVWSPPSVCLFVVAGLLLRRQFLNDLIQVKAGRPLSDRKFLEGRQPLSDHRLSRHNQEHPFGHPFAVFERSGTLLERIGAQVVDLWNPEVGEIPLPDVESGVFLLLEGDLLLIDAQGDQVAVVTPVEECFAGWCVHLTFEERRQIVAVEVDFERRISRLAGFHTPSHHIRITTGRGESGGGPRGRRVRPCRRDRCPCRFFPAIPAGRTSR